MLREHAMLDLKWQIYAQGNIGTGGKKLAVNHITPRKLRDYTPDGNRQSQASPTASAIIIFKYQLHRV
jgi:hypothetical protein